jgi:hypothetical protein
MDTIDPPKWYRVSVTYLSQEQKDELIHNGWIQSSTYPKRGLYKKGTGNSRTDTLLYDAIASANTAANTTDVKELEEMLGDMKVGGRRKSKSRKSRKSRKSKKTRKSKSRKTKSRKK